MHLVGEMERLEQELESIKAAISALENLVRKRQDKSPIRAARPTCASVKTKLKRPAEASEG